ncbi:MAG: class GN sortase [Pseudomonadota bacterium]
MRNRFNNAHKFALAMVMLTGAALTASALYIPAKAQLGQSLLQDAWQEAKAGMPAKPWPWADIEPVAKLAFPSLGVEQLVLNEASGEAMAWGPGHVTGTEPLGAPGLSAAAAHRDTHFAHLGDLAPGDTILLETKDGLKAEYRVDHAMVIDATQWRFPDIKDGPDRLALSTCWPLDSLTPGPERLVVFADRVNDPNTVTDSAAPEPGNAPNGTTPNGAEPQQRVDAANAATRL